MSIPLRKIGDTSVTAIGYGAMGIAGAFYGKPLPDEERFKVLDAVYEHGCTFWDTADMYLDSEDLIGRWFKRTGKREDIFLATKCGFVQEPNRLINCEPEYIKHAFSRSLQRLGVDTIDLFYLHRADPQVSIELSVGAMADLVREGKVKYIGLSEPSANTLRRAHAIHPIAAVQVEYSAIALDIEDPKIGLLETARELGVKIIAYSPLGHGLLTGRYNSPDEFEEGDFRLSVPRFSKENFPNILKLAEGLKKIGDRYNTTAGQVALAWLLAQGEDVFPIPGTTKIPSLKENLAAAHLKLTPAEVKEVREMAKAADAGLPRYPEAMLATMFVETPALK